MKPQDDQNFVICEIAETIYQVPKTLAVVHNPKNIEVFQGHHLRQPVSPRRIEVEHQPRGRRVPEFRELFDKGFYTEYTGCKGRFCCFLGDEVFEKEPGPFARKDKEALLRSFPPAIAFRQYRFQKSDHSLKI